MRGGLDQVRYFLGGTYADEVGVLDYNTNKRSRCARTSRSCSPRTSTSTSRPATRTATRASRPSTKRAASGTSWCGAVATTSPATATPNGSGFLGFQERFPQSYEGTDISRDYSRFTASAQATHTYGEWFTQRLILGVDRGWETDNSFIPGNSDFPNAPAGALIYGRPIDQNLTFDYSVSARLQATEDIRATTSFGAQYYSRFRESVVNSGRGFPTTVQTVISQTEFGDRQVDFSSIEEKSLGFFVQEELNWQDRIYLTGAVRADDNSAFGSHFDLQYYPKVSASWVLSEESFFNVGFISSLRFRGAWGKAGRQPGTFASQTLYGTFIGPNGNGLDPDDRR